MRITRTGLGLAAIYLLLMCACAIWANFVSDPKGKFAILQLPVALQHGLLLIADATHLLKGMSWALVYLVLGTPMILALVFVGWVFEWAVAKINRSVAPISKLECK